MSNTENITKAIITVMWEVNNIEKNTTVWSGNNSYKAVSDKDVKKAIRESMIKNWLSILQTGVQANKQIDRWEEVDTWAKVDPKPMKTKQSVFTEVTTKYILLHKSWESIELEGYGQWVDTQDKWAWKATTYALKNTLINIFLVPTGEDTDNTHSNDIPVPQKSYQAPSDLYTMTLKDIDIWEGKVYGRSIYLNWEKKTISDEQIAKLKAHEKYIELPKK